jgi:hypothetical protein
MVATVASPLWPNVQPKAARAPDDLTS